MGYKFRLKGTTRIVQEFPEMSYFGLFGLESVPITEDNNRDFQGVKPLSSFFWFIWSTGSG